RFCRCLFFWAFWTARRIRSRHRPPPDRFGCASTVMSNMREWEIGRSSLTSTCAMLPRSRRPSWSGSIHGGGWSAGDKFPTPAARLVAAGYAIASVEYRLTGEAKFPAQIHDCKAAIRWLRANAQKYNLDSAHIGVWGHSSGGHLVSLLGTSGDVKELEGAEGNLDQSSRVQAVVDFSGPADLLRTDPSGTKPKDNDGYRAFIGGPLLDRQDI